MHLSEDGTECAECKVDDDQDDSVPEWIRYIISGVARERRDGGEMHHILIRRAMGSKNMITVAEW